MDAGGWAVVITAVGTVVMGVLGAIFKGRQDKQRDVLQALNEHIIRLEKMNNHKDKVLDEMSWLQHRCEVREQASRSWMERANDLMNMMVEEIGTHTGKKFTALELPPKEQNTDADRAAYYANRSKYNTALNQEVKNELSSQFPGKKSTNVQNPGS